MACRYRKGKQDQNTQSTGAVDSVDQEGADVVEECRHCQKSSNLEQRKWKVGGTASTFLSFLTQISGEWLLLIKLNINP